MRAFWKFRSVNDVKPFYDNCRNDEIWHWNLETFSRNTSFSRYRSSWRIKFSRRIILSSGVLKTALCEFSFLESSPSRSADRKWPYRDFKIQLSSATFPEYWIEKLLAWRWVQRSVQNTRRVIIDIINIEDWIDRYEFKKPRDSKSILEQTQIYRVLQINPRTGTPYKKGI